MAIEWTPDLATGVDLIDAQHKELFSRINNLLEACKQGKGKEEVGKTIAFLEQYVVEHFSAEEKQMSSAGYPAAPAHKAQHHIFMENFSSLKQKFEAEGPGVHIVVGTNQFVVDWLRSHIRKLDKELGQFLKSRPAA
ncbi:MAG: bacteriohemerythrin [Nitrospiraceae bacterium]|nr:bacteriohemerythrin [Nitrospiraceae bacterium]